MDYMLMDSSGNALDHYATWNEMEAALSELVRERPEVSRDLAVVRFDENGRPVGEPYTVADIVPTASRGEITLNVSSGFSWLRRGQATYIPLAPHPTVASPQQSDAFHITPTPA